MKNGILAKVAKCQLDLGCLWQQMANMSDAEKSATVEKSRQMHTRADMENFVNSLGESRDKMF